jgi:hypothetical protein
MLNFALDRRSNCQQRLALRPHAAANPGYCKGVYLIDAGVLEVLAGALSINS